MPKLTKRLIESIKPPESGFMQLWDDVIKGFGIRILPSGTISYIVYYRTKTRRQRKMTIGRHGTITLSKARKRAKQILGEVASDSDPAAERELARREPAFSFLAKEYIKRRCSQKKSGKEDERIIHKELIPRWGSISAREIKRRDVIYLVDQITERGAPIMANRTLSVINRIYNFGIERDMISISNPAYKVKPPNKEIPRDRVLTEKEIIIFWKNLDNMIGVGTLIKSALKLILITAQRPGEILRMEWSEIDLDSGWWIIPAEKSKNNLPHRVPLSTLAIKNLRELSCDGKFVFPSRIGSSISHRKPMATGALSRAISANCDLFHTYRFTPHDLRRTAASHMASMGVARLTISKILNHSESGVTAIYDRHSYDSEKRTALTAWSEKLENILTGTKNNIITLIR